jgi:hypothetical protein
MNTLFIAAGAESWASSRIRAFWPARHMPETEVITWSEWEAGNHPDVDVYIFQKNAKAGQCRQLVALGKQVWWDVSDPVWWWEPAESRAIAEAVTGIVACTPALAADLAGFGFKAQVIPDRLDLAHYDRQAVHTERQPARLIWFGLALNRVALFAALANLDRLAANGIAIELTLLDNRPDDPVQWSDNFPIYNGLWRLEHEVAALAAHDLAVLPPYPGPWGRVKSNNKHLTAWACGLPVASGEHYPELERLVLSATARAEAAGRGREWVERDYRAEQSAAEWEQLLSQRDATPCA